MDDIVAGVGEEVVLVCGSGGGIVSSELTLDYTADERYSVLDGFLGKGRKLALTRAGWLRVS